MPQSAFPQQLVEFLGSRDPTIGPEQKTLLTGGAAGEERGDFLLQELLPREDSPPRAEEGGHDKASRTIMREASEHLEAPRRRNRTGFMMAVALHRRRVGVPIAVTEDGLRMRTLRLQIAEDYPGATLTKLSITIVPYRGEVAEEDAATAPQDERHVLKKTTAEFLPQNVRNIQ